MNFTSPVALTGKPEKFWVNPLLYDAFVVFNLFMCGEVIGVLGIIGNVVNIVNFYRQGLSDSVLVTLTALAVSDIGALVTQQGYNIMVNPWFTAADLDFSVLDIVAVFCFYPHGYFIRASGLVMTFAAVERCASVIWPLKVKVIFTKRVALAVNASIFVLLAVDFFPVYYVSQFGYQFMPDRNRTIYTKFYRSNSDSILHVSYLLTDLTLPFFTFSVNIVCTVIIIVQLKMSAEWRSTVSTGINQDGRESALTNKQKKTTVMLVTVSIIFVTCLVPQASLLTALGIVRELKVGGAYFDIALVCYTFTFLLETVNCSVSILVYYNMSSRYRAVAQEMFGSLGKKISINPPTSSLSTKPS